MDIEKLIARLNEYSAEYQQHGGITAQAADALTAFQTENEKLRDELELVKRTLAMMWFAYVNSDKEDPHNYETEALEEAERLLGPWKECMPKYFGRAALSNAVKSENEFVEYGSEEE